MGTIRIISRSSEPFKDRSEAGKLLAGALKAFAGKGTVVLGIPRGGIVIADEIARFLNAELDIVLSRKIGAPDNPELAIGSIGEDGRLILHDDLAARVGADREYVEEEKAHQMREIKNRIRMFRQVKTKIPLLGKTVIVTDDGIATGATMQAALWACRRENPQKLIGAVPIGANDSIERLAPFADEMIVLRLPSRLYAIGEFYKDFLPTRDEEVLQILKHSVLGSEESHESNISASRA